MSEISWPPNWPRVLEARLGTPPPGEYRATPEAFLVEELLDFAPEGQGEHLWLWVEKRDLTTIELVKRLARACEVRPRDIGYAGLKDRQAVTRQWLSVHLPGREAPEDLEARLGETPVRLLEYHRHPRKLKRGVHKGNRFRLRLTGEACEDPGFAARWQALIEQGVPNYFGPQRFGHEGRNLGRAEALLGRGWRKRADPEGLLLSAARSYLFNQLLATRIAEGNWATPLPGELVILDGTASQFLVETPDAELLARAERLDLHPSGVLWGKGALGSREQAAQYEQALTMLAPALCAGLEAAGVSLGRRALRLRLGHPSLQRDAGGLWLAFDLPRGGFATAVLRELISHPTL
ncbi:tRNA pseudouridine(13) synthase TruD [Halomonas salifodinae]|uniref:tRNA pseudouridine synthase D n=1 Tax=Halomonas salifodinae TaxID=438745 RepID=A0ABW2F464_9GAMM